MWRFGDKTACTPFLRALFLTWIVGPFRGGCQMPQKWKQNNRNTFGRTRSWHSWSSFIAGDKAMRRKVHTKKIRAKKTNDQGKNEKVNMTKGKNQKKKKKTHGSWKARSKESRFARNNNTKKGQNLAGRGDPSDSSLKSGNRCARTSSRQWFAYSQW